jgi:hypothetical protein
VRPGTSKNDPVVNLSMKAETDEDSSAAVIAFSRVVPRHIALEVVKHILSLPSFTDLEGAPC